MSIETDIYYAVQSAIWSGEDVNWFLLEVRDSWALVLEEEKQRAASTFEKALRKEG